MKVEKPSFWGRVWCAVWGKVKAAARLVVSGFLSPIVAPVLATIAVVLIVVVAVVLVSMGFKELQIGGLIARLLGKKPPLSDVEIANSVPEDRIDADGRVIPPGQADSKGQTQAVVVPIKHPGLFSNPDTVEFTPPGEDAPIEVPLPDGVRARDVDKVIVIQPEKFVVTVKDSSGVSAKSIDEVLRKYESAGK